MREKHNDARDVPASEPAYAVEFGTGRPVALRHQGTVTSTVRKVKQAVATARRAGG